MFVVEHQRDWWLSLLSGSVIPNFYHLRVDIYIQKLYLFFVLESKKPTISFLMCHFSVLGIMKQHLVLLHHSNNIAGSNLLVG